mmetsp:Transcript_16207/g.45171  ORF Transcript_16207/g.45171 Transcript_16207/m.45171 type:complete len:117 (-) Transcript_16207:649-999(-)
MDTALLHMTFGYFILPAWHVFPPCHCPDRRHNHGQECWFPLLSSLVCQGDLANLQREILGAAIPDKLCNSLGGLLVRMPHGKRAALYNGITCLGFHSLLDFLYQACTAAECLQQRQ